jgi:hypothetical protein
MAYKQTPGRGNGMKTGRGISPTLMGGSAMYQTKKPTTKKEQGLGDKIVGYVKKAEKALTGSAPSGGNRTATKQEKISVGDYSMDITGPNAFKVNKKTGSPAKQTKKPVAKKEEGLGDKIVGYVKKAEKALTGSAPSGGNRTATKQEKISLGDYSMDITGPNAFKVNKKTGTKSPAKQVSKMPTAKAGSQRDKRSVDTMEKDRGRTLERNGTKEMPKANKKASKSPINQMSKLKKKC